MKTIYLKFIYLLFFLITILPSLSFAAKIELTTSSPTKNGNLKFKLIDPHGNVLNDKVFEVKCIKNEAATVKAARIRDTIAAHLGEGWSCVLVGNKLTFSRTGGTPPALKDVIQMEIVDDASKEVEELGVVAATHGGRFDFGLCNINSSGLDDNGNPSVLALSTSSGSYSTTIPANANVVTLIDGLYNDLLVDGVNITRTSPTSVRIIDASPNPFMNFTMNDTDLCLSGVVARAIFPIPTLPQWGLIILGILLLTLSVFYIKK